MISDEAGYLTTGEAARLLAVTPDTVLKWIHKGRIAAVQTAGGHHRIGMSEIRRLLGEGGSPGPQVRMPDAVHRCWEYFGEGSSIRAGCLQCVVYRFRAACCYEVQATPGLSCSESRMCAGFCAACPYYLRIHNLPQRVLVVSRDEAWLAGLRQQAAEGLAVSFANGVYEASAAVGETLPSLVLLDSELPASEIETLREALGRDRRVPWVRVYLAGEAEGGGAALPRDLRVEDLVPLVNSMAVEQIGS